MTKRKKRKRVIIDRRVASLLGIALLLTASCLPLWSDSKSHARDPYALLFGTIYGPDERPIYGVKIKIRRSDQKKAKWEVISNHQGEFAQRVPAGRADYVITADVKERPKPELTVHIDKDERKDFTLHLK
jgi:hypothetical protein